MIVGARRIGFALSGLLHLGIGAAVLSPGGGVVAPPVREHRMALDLTMFVAPAPPVESTHTAVDAQPAIERPAAVPRPAPLPPPVGESRRPAAPPVPAPETVVRRPRPEPATKARNTEKPRAVSRRTKKAATTPVPEVSRPPQAVPAPASGKPPAERVDEQAAVGVSPVVDSGSVERAYLGELVAAIHRHRHYPRRARRRGEQGTVLLAFVIERDGSLSGIRVARSSGSRWLDDAAVATLRRLSPVSAIPPALQRDRWSISVPLEFRLK